MRLMGDFRKRGLKVDRMTHFEYSRLFPQVFLSLSNELITMAMMAKMELLHELSNMDFSSPRLT